MTLDLPYIYSLTHWTTSNTIGSISKSLTLQAFLILWGSGTDVWWHPHQTYWWFLPFQLLSFRRSSPSSKKNSSIWVRLQSFWITIHHWIISPWWIPLVFFLQHCPRSLRPTCPSFKGSRTHSAATSCMVTGSTLRPSLTGWSDGPEAHLMKGRMPSKILMVLHPENWIVKTGGKSQSIHIPIYACFYICIYSSLRPPWKCQWIWNVNAHFENSNVCPQMLSRKHAASSLIPSSRCR